MRDNIIVRYFKKTSNLNKVLFVFLFVFLLVGNVKAQGTVPGNSKAVYNTEESAKEAAEHKGSSLTNNGKNSFIVGLRVSILKSDGTEIFSNDYVDYTYASDYYVTYTNRPNSKVNAGNVPSLGSWTKKSIASINELQKKFTDSGISIDIAQLLKGKTISKDSLFDDMIKNKDTDQAKKFFKQFIEENIEEYYNSEKQAYDLFFVWEPLAKFNYKNWYTWDGALKDISRDVYLGTIYELSMALNHNDNVGYIEANRNCTSDNEKGCILKKVNEECVINGGVCDDPEENEYKYTLKPYTGLSGFLRQLTINMACSTFLEDTDEWGNLVSQKFSNNFSDRSFFNGKLKSEDAADVNIGCTYEKPWKYLYYPAINSDSSLGIGILWFDEIANSNQITCYDVEEVYGKTDLLNSIISGTANFDEFNKNWVSIHGSMPINLSSGVTAEWYEQYCMKDDPKPEPGQPLKYNCTPTTKLSNCDSKGIQYYDVNENGAIDTDYWRNCIFNDNGRYDNLDEHKLSDKNNSLTYYEPNLGSEYCEVYCVESVDASFDSDNPTVLAGSNFKWGYGSVQTKRRCYTKSINWNSFLNDLNQANTNVLKEYANQLLYELNRGGSWNKTESTCGCTCDLPGFNGTGGCPKQTCKDFDYEYKIGNNSPVPSVTVYGPAGQKQESKSLGDSPFKTCGSTTDSPVKDNSEKLQAAKAKVSEIIGDMKKCYTFADENVLNDQSTATISYSGNQYNYNVEMEVTRSVTGKLESKDECQTVQLDALKSCTDNTCSGTESVKDCSTYGYWKEVDSDSKFSLKDGIFQYVLKNNNLSIHKWELSNYNTNALNYIDIGSSNFPVPFNSNDGTYEDVLKIEYSKLGHFDSIKGKTAVDSILKSIGNKSNIEYGTWSCDYTVESKLIPDKDPSCEGEHCNPNPSCEGDNCNSSKAGDINVIYREIDLEQPFPDTNANNRYTGANWCDGYDCSWNNATSNRVIINNRNVKGSEIYNKDPMYTFIMTPRDIIQIRGYNDKNAYTSYTGSYDGKNYDFKCKEGTGENCISDYLTELMKMMNTSDNPGTCKNNRETDNYDFDACRIHD